MTRSGTIQVLIIDDHSMVAAALAAALDTEAGLQVVGTAGDLDSAVDVLRTQRVDVVLLDVRLGDGVDSLASVGLIRRAAPSAKVVILSGWSDDHSISRAIEARCDGYLLKEQHIAELVAGVRAAADDDAVFAPAIMKRVFHLLQPTHATSLTTRELDVLQRLGAGCSTNDIATATFVSVNTVRNHVQRVIHKLGVHSRGEAVACGVRSGMITVE